MRGAVLDEPECGRLTVVGPGRVGMLRRQAVLDRDDRDAAAQRQRLEAVVLQAARPEDEAAAVEVQVDAANLGRREHAHRDAAGAVIRGQL